MDTSGKTLSLEQSGEIVLAACAPEHPRATAEDSIGGLYSLPALRAIFKKRIVDGARRAGFRLAMADIPADDETDLGTIIDAVCSSAVSLA